MFIKQPQVCRMIQFILFTAFISKTISPAVVPLIVGKFKHIEQITNKAHRGQIIGDTVKNGSAANIHMDSKINPNLANPKPSTQFRWGDQSAPNIESIPKVADENAGGYDDHLDRAIKNRRAKMKQTPRRYYKYRSESPRLQFKTYFLDPWKSFFLKMISSLKPFVLYSESKNVGLTFNIQDVCCNIYFSNHSSRYYKPDPDLTPGVDLFGLVHKVHHGFSKPSNLSMHQTVFELGHGKKRGEIATSNEQPFIDIHSRKILGRICISNDIFIYWKGFLKYDLFAQKFAAVVK
ncbi:uncharacterized protein MELLADRAFT_109539 [Melampsora larici-populina 98AG31]|uniref:Uncharacterized protein n=1 Tax=Melampsora larici-populina (strain 98AG31 / pathotype 3-4-7) TaxID=747676 RepID=F4RWT3_MELLP|nr:uncharacterized protein MELLADRAFT_109539 [Melampsora larici-populina 98AG31]EGG03171.1 hypothetical protein MELLADRAFT_109539 [Melampsora larici-populina 98AG31]